MLSSANITNQLCNNGCGLRKLRLHYDVGIGDCRSIEYGAETFPKTEQGDILLMVAKKQYFLDLLIGAHANISQGWRLSDVAVSSICSCCGPVSGCGTLVGGSVTCLLVNLLNGFIEVR